VRILAVFALAMLAGGCALPKSPELAPPAPATPRAANKPAPAEENRGDEAIGKDVRRQLDLIGATDTAGVVIEVDDGVVTLRGVAPTMAAAWRAEGVARTVAGVKSVVNRLQALGQATTP
jgi:osmotically-inducible protein OsmY